MAEAAKAVVTQVTETPRIQVVTNENFNEYVAEKLNLKPAEPSPEDKAAEELKKVEAEKAARLKAAKDEDEPGSALGDKVSDEDKHGINERFRKQTEARKAAEAKAAEAATRAEKAEREAADLKARYEKPVEDLGPEPDPTQFTDVAEYSKAIKEWTADKTEREFTAKQALKQQQDAWNARVASTKAKIPDFDARMGQGAQITPEMAAEIRTADNGPEILLHLAEHPEEAARIRGLTIAGMIREMGKLEVKLGSADKPQTKSAEVKVAEVEVSKAPEPITPLKGGSPTSGILHGHDEVPKSMTYEEWKAAYNAGKIK